MLSASFDFRRQTARNTKTLLKATLTLADGTVREIVGDDVIMGSAAFSDSVSGDGSFDIGAAVINQFAVDLNNYDGRWDAYDFEGASIVPYVGVELPNGGTEWLMKGHYLVEQPESYGSTVGLTCLDRMSKFEQPYSIVGTEYPATLQTIVQDICTACGVVLLSSDFANRGYVVAERPDDNGTLTCLAMIAYAAQASGNFARCDVNGRLVIDWYNTGAFEAEGWLDGEAFDDASPYASGDTADGGSFTDYSAGASCDGGALGANTYAVIHAISALTIATDDVVITGVSVTAQDGEDDDGEVAHYPSTGYEGYVLAIGDNPLIQYGEAATVAAQVGARVVGMRFRPFDVSALGDPIIEAGDPVIIVDRQQRQYRSYITSLTYKAGHFEAFACNAETPGRNRASTFSAMTEAIVKARNAVKREKTARELAIASLAEQLSESSGLFKTEVPQQDGSTIYYMHDKPTLAESQTVWKLTANALGVSSDGGLTYPFGLDVSGTAILERIYTVGLDADYLRTGRIEVRDPQTNAAVFVADIDTGEVSISPATTVGDRTMGQLISGVDSGITGIAVLYAKNQSRTQAPDKTNDNLWSTECPAWQQGWYIWQMIATTDANSTEKSDPVCISGRDGATGMNAATVYLYQRKSTQPVKTDIGTLTYTFETAALSGTLGAWSRSIPSGSDTCWVIVATAISNGDTDTIPASEFSEPVALTAAGIDGLNQATIYLYRRSPSWRVREGALEAPTAAAMSVSGTVATIPGTVDGTTFKLASEAPAKPSSATSYTFSTGVLSPLPSGWYQEIPDGDDTIWVTTAVAISSSATDSIAASEWSDVVKLSERGDAMSGPPVEQYYLSTSSQTQTGGSWSSEQPRWESGKFIWVRSKITWDDGAVTYTDPVLATTANGIGEAVAKLDTELDYRGVFARLTDNGKVQGIWLKGQALYMNASYVNTGTLTVTNPTTGDTVFAANLDDGTVEISGSCVKIGSSSLTTVIDGVQALYGTCATESATAAKVVACSGFQLRTGAAVTVKFTHANTASNPTLNVNGTGAKAIKLNGSAIPQAAWWPDGGTMGFVYDGTSWAVADGSTAATTATNKTDVANLTLRADAFDVSVSGIKATYATCSTIAATQVKAVTIAGFTKYVGQTVTVKFSYGNTAQNPKLKVQNSDASVVAEGFMLVNNSIMGSPYYWGDQAVLTFVWSGSYWVVADGSTLSQIKVLRDSITLSVTDASLGNSATIKLEVNGRTAQEETIDLTGVRNAFKNDTTAITISAGTVTFNSNTFVVNSTNFSVTNTGVITAKSGTIGGMTIAQSSLYNSKMTLDSDGLTLKHGTTTVGNIGTNSYVNDSTKKGLVFDLEYAGAYMCWSVKESSSASTYTMKVGYVNKAFNSNTAGRFHVWCPQDFHGYRAYNFWIDPDTGGANGGITGTMNFVQVRSINSDGTVHQWNTGCKMRFKNGLLVEGTFNS